MTESGLKNKALFIFSRYHKDPKNIHHKCGTGIAQLEILGLLENMGYDVFFGGQEDLSYPKEYVVDSKFIIYIAPAIFKILKHKPKGKLILFANNSHVKVRNQRMRDSAKRWGLPVESLGPEKYFLPAYEKSDYIFVGGNKSCVQTFLDNGVPTDKIKLWHNSVYPEVFKPGTGEKFNKFTFVHWSSEIGLRKGLPAILAAWKKWNNPNAQLVLMGILTKVGKKLLYKRNWYGKLVPNYAENIVVYSGGSQGFPSQDPFVLQTLQKSHVGVFPTLEDNQPASVMEMASSGLPIITTEESGFNLDDSWSYKVKMDDVDTLVQAFEKAFTDSELQKKGNNARNFMIENHNWEDFHKMFPEFIKSLN